MKLSDNAFAKFYYDIDMQILLGSNEKNRELFRNITDKSICDIKIIPYGKKVLTTDGKEVKGICKKEKNDKYLIVINDYNENLPMDAKKWVIHEGLHEFCHLYADILSSLCDEHKDGILNREKNELRKNNLGLIETTDSKTGKFIGINHYFKTFNETMMDLISTIGLEKINGKNRIDDVFNGKKNGVKTAFSKYTPLTLLYISAFSNTPNPNYNNIINNKNGLVFQKIRTVNNKELKLNDFIYGTFCDPLYIEEEFDKYVGKDEFNILSTTMDMFYAKNQEFFPRFVEINIEKLSLFLRNKINSYLSNKTFSYEEAYKIAQNYNIQLYRTCMYYKIPYKNFIELKTIKNIKEKE